MSDSQCGWMVCRRRVGCVVDVVVVGVGVRRDASMSRRGVLEFDDPMEM